MNRIAQGFEWGMKVKVLGFVATSLMFVSCGKPDSGDSSDLKYIVSGKAYAGLLRKVHNPSIRLCMGTSASVVAHKDDVAHAITEWTNALTDIAAKPVTHTTEFVALNDPTCDAVVNIGNYNPANTSMGNRPVLNLAYSGWYGSRTVTLHEFGHAFGLGDTYEGRGGSCQTKQPDSVMCRASYDALKKDDIDGIRAAYKNALSRNFAADDDSVPMVIE